MFSQETGKTLTFHQYWVEWISLAGRNKIFTKSPQPASAMMIIVMISYDNPGRQVKPRSFILTSAVCLKLGENTKAS